MAGPVVKFSSQEEHYIADACVVWCFDDRFYKLLKAFGKQEGFVHIDLVKVAGGAKALAGGPEDPGHQFVLDQIKASVRLHGTKRVVLMTHRDCGGYGGSKSFADPDAERDRHAKDLTAAKKSVEYAVPGVAVETYFADFDGLYLIARGPFFSSA